ncbi:glycosyltransferase family 4 protein [Zwartia vadi]|uniref:glycosyltransferase family 4 protein n=1 Tax=Zwartia vadi TaxID=3058168 RepID=UPI0025B5DC0C|nr:glycosyltransferase family 1 protein [Zwartia vadi]MDN3988217.1 glycosyltransferase family 1 protein [Zwartia vadi]
MLNVGFGVTALCKGLNNGSLDGIGTYSRELMSQWKRSDPLNATLEPPRLIPFSFGSLNCQSLAPAPIKLAPYPLSAAWSVATKRGFCGLSQLSIKVDLIHATDRYVPKSSTVPVVATIMDALPLSHPEWSRSEFRATKNFLWRRALDWADNIITISDYSKQQLIQWANISPKKITVIPLGVAPEWFECVSQKRIHHVKYQYALPEMFFISVGTLQPRKNIARTIQAHRMLPETIRKRAPLIIVGSAGWKSEEVLNLIDQEKINGSVRWLQHVPHVDLLPILTLSSALVFPSLAEGFGLPVLEAFAANVPVITSNTTSLPEVAGDAAILINPLDVQEICIAMQRSLEDNTLVEKNKNLGLARARQFTWETCAKATLGVYRKTLL